MLETLLDDLLGAATQEAGSAIEEIGRQWSFGLSNDSAPFDVEAEYRRHMVRCI